MSSIRMSPNSREVIGAISTITSRQEYLKSTNGALNVAGSFSLSGQAIPASGLTTAVAVQIVDGSGNQISSFGGGTQYAELTTTSPGTGTLALARYNSTLPTLTDGQMHGLQLDTRGGLQIVVTDRDGTSGAVVGSQGTNIVTNINGLQTRSTLYGQFDDVTPGALTEDRLGIQRMSANRNAYTTIRDAAGNERGANVTASSELLITGAVTLASTTITGTVAVTESGTWNVGSSSATGSAPPANAFYQGLNDGTNLIGALALNDNADTISPSATNNKQAVISRATVFDDNASTWNRQKSARVGLNTSGAGVAAAGLVANFDDVAPGAITENNFGTVRMSANRNLYGTIRDAAGNERGVNVTASSELLVTGAVTNAGTFAVQATLSAETTKVIGTVNQGTSPWVVSNSVLSVVGNGAAATAQRVTLANDSTGVIATVGAVTAITNALPAGTNILGRVGIDQTTPGTTNLVALTAETTKVIGVVRNADGSGNLLTSTGNALDINLKTSSITLPVSIAGTVVVDDLAAAPTGGAVPANAQYQGLNATTALPTAATPGNLTGQTGDKYGRTVMLPNATRDIMGTQPTTITSSTAETTIITQAASIFNDLVSIFISNTSATPVSVAIRDATGGTVIFTLYVPATDMRGISLTTPWPQTTVNNNWTATSSGSVSSLVISTLFVKNR